MSSCKQNAPGYVNASFALSSGSLLGGCDGGTLLGLHRQKLAARVYIWWAKGAYCIRIFMIASIPTDGPATW